MVLAGVTTGRHEEFDWVFRGGVARLFPEQWERLLSSVPAEHRDRDILDAFDRLLDDPNPVVRERAVGAWCLWESATPGWPPTPEMDERFTDLAYATAFARIVVHYARSYAWLEDGALLRGAGALADIPGVLVNGRFDFQAPIANAWTLHRAWPRAELVIVDDAGHHANADLTRCDGPRARPLRRAALTRTTTRGVRADPPGGGSCRRARRRSARAPARRGARRRPRR